jgi:hypothetical protein
MKNIGHLVQSNSGLKHINEKPSATIWTFILCMREARRLCSRAKGTGHRAQQWCWYCIIQGDSGSGDGEDGGGSNILGLVSGVLGSLSGVSIILLKR